MAKQENWIFYFELLILLRRYHAFHVRCVQLTAPRNDDRSLQSRCRVQFNSNIPRTTYKSYIERVKPHAEFRVKIQV